MEWSKIYGPDNQPGLDDSTLNYGALADDKCYGSYDSGPCKKTDQDKGRVIVIKEDNKFAAFIPHRI